MKTHPRSNNRGNADLLLILAVILIGGAIFAGVLYFQKKNTSKPVASQITNAPAQTTTTQQIPTSAKKFLPLSPGTRWTYEVEIVDTNLAFPDIRPLQHLMQVWVETNNPPSEAIAKQAVHRAFLGMKKKPADGYKVSFKVMKLIPKPNSPKIETYEVRVERDDIDYFTQAKDGKFLLIFDSESNVVSFRQPLIQGPDEVHLAGVADRPFFLTSEVVGVEARKDDLEALRFDGIQKVTRLDLATVGRKVSVWNSPRGALNPSRALYLSFQDRMVFQENIGMVSLIQEVEVGDQKVVTMRWWLSDKQ